MPLVAKTNVHALCRKAKTKLDHPSQRKRFRCGKGSIDSCVNEFTAFRLNRSRKAAAASTAMLRGNHNSFDPALRIRLQLVEYFCSGFAYGVCFSSESEERC